MSKYFGTYLEGVKLCEEMYNFGFGYKELTYYLTEEKLISDYRWSEFFEGFEAAIGHFKRLDEIYKE